MKAHWIRTAFVGALVIAAGQAYCQDVVATEMGVRIRFGLTDERSTKWDGTITPAEGHVTHISGWRFAKGDSVDGVQGWKASTRPLAQTGRGNNQGKAAAAAAKRQAQQTKQPMADNGVVVSFTDVKRETAVTVKTAQGDFEFTFAELTYGKIVEKLEGKIEIERTASAAPLTNQPSDDDYPAAAVGPDGTVHVAYVSFTHGDRSAYKPLEEETGPSPTFANSGRGWKQAPEDFKFLANPVGGDRVWLRSLRAGKWSEPVAVTDGGGDIYKCAVAVDGRGQAVVVWSQNTEYPQKDANFEILSRTVSGDKLGEIVNVSQNAGSDINPAAATDAQGRVWLAWQGVRDGLFRIHERHQQADGTWSAERTVSSHSRNCWTPAVAAAHDGRVAIAWDTYDKGDYDVFFREYSSADGAAQEPMAAADSADYEARPAITYDKAGALWISYELGDPSWGKDSGPYDNGGNPLYRGRQVGLIVRQGGRWKEPAVSFVGKLPGAGQRKRVNNARVPPIEPQGESPQQARNAEMQRDLAYNNLARIGCDPQGRIWLLCRSRHNDFRFPMLGSLWLSHAVCWDGQKWIGPILLPNSDNLMYNTPSLAMMPHGDVLVAHSSDHRQDRFPERNEGEVPSAAADPFDNDVFITRIVAPLGKMGEQNLQPAKFPPSGKTAPSEATLAERAAIERCRNQMIGLGDRKLRLIRGEYHRHTEISGDGGNDGPLEDMWRYALDVSQMDWLGNADHDNGAGREYTWWLTQKTTEAFRIPGKFEPPFTYERSVRYPEGHRNVMFAERGIRTLPRLPITDRDYQGHAPDTQMLYKYLKAFGGVCASHTSATGMGTDWRDNDPEVEPMVEIYQGDRQNYERPGAPRCPTAEYSIGGWEPKGFVNLALAKGYRLAFQCSSDHLSTHISYAHVYAENNSREALIKAIKERHIYGSTDNIVAEFRSKVDGVEHILGDEFSTSTPPKFELKLVGTAPFAKVTLVKDDVEIPLPCDSKAEISLTWTDPQPTAGKTSYYYVRGEQTDGELVWVSPMWVKYQPTTTAGGE